MERRTFVKALIFAVPALYIEPLTCLSNVFLPEIMEMQKQEFVVYFFGDYGRQVLERFRYLRRLNPIREKCDNITMDVNSEVGFITVSEYLNPIDLVVRTLNADVACVVMDTRQPNAVALAETICEIGRRGQGNIFICLSPVISNTVKKGTFNMAVETLSGNIDLSASFLLTLWNTYLGCGGMGEFQCMKYLIDVAELQNNRFVAVIGEAVQKGNIRQIDIARLTTSALRVIMEWHKNDLGGIYYGMLELNPSESHILPFLDNVSTTIQQAIGGQSHGLMIHLGLTQQVVKLTMLNLRQQED